MRSRILVRCLFGAALLILPLQLIAAEAGREPYPALTLPSFSDPSVVRGELAQTLPVATVRFTDGTSEPFRLRSLLPAGAPVGFGVLRSALWDPDEAVTPATRAWMARRLAELLPGRTAESIVIDWVRTKYDFDDGRITDRQVSSTVTIELGG
jgi:hypothetical protein